MTKLHEILAVDKDKERQAKIIHDETVKMFGKPNYFTSFHKKLEMFDDNRSHEADAFEEETALATTVPKRLAYTAGFLASHLDVLFQKEATNQEAAADIKIDGELFFAQVPATMLLALERELGKYRAMMLAIPTLDAGVEWLKDSDYGEDIFVAVNSIKAHKTEKTLKIISLAAATPQHKEQVTTQNQDAIVGQYITKKWSGMVTSAQKAGILSRFDELLLEIKQARMRANEQEVIKKDIGSKIFDFILG